MLKKPYIMQEKTKVYEEIHKDRQKLGEVSVLLAKKHSPFDDYLEFLKNVLNEIGPANHFYESIVHAKSLNHFDKITYRFDDKDEFTTKENHNPNLVKNRMLLKEILRAANISKRECSELLWKHSNSLDGYLHKFSRETFPPSFSYFFLNSIFFYTEISSRTKQKRNSQKFEEIIKDAMDIGIEKKLILPALEHHMSIIVKSSIAIPKRSKKKLGRANFIGRTNFK